MSFFSVDSIVLIPTMTLFVNVSDVSLVKSDKKVYIVRSITYMSYLRCCLNSEMIADVYLIGGN